MKTFSEDTVDVQMTATQRRVAAYLVHASLPAGDVSELIGGRVAGKPSWAIGFLQRLDKRLLGSWWRVENDMGRWRVVRRTTKETSA